MKTMPILALLAAVLATASIVRTQPQREKTDPPALPPVSPYAHTVAAAGIVEPSTENLSIGTPIAGVVSDVFAKAGQRVAAGAPLFCIDTRHLLAQLEVRKAALETAVARVQTAETQLADERDQQQRAQKLAAERVISPDELARRQFAVETAQARLVAARADVATARAQIRETETDIARSVITAPIDADVLQVKVRAGEYAPAGQTREPLLTLGQLRPLHLRVDVDEHEGWRVQPDAAARALLRGNAGLSTPLRFVRLEPMVVPKRSLTGESTERVDTRVLQVIYEVLDHKLPLFPGQQMDAFIEARPPTLAQAQ
jgi:multidrug efflux pump subunit AcrA (membrane-fusion protein)